MGKAIRIGWNLALRHKYALIALFLYRLLWGFFLFRFIDGVVTPILARYPDDHPSSEAVPLFWAEAEFRLIKTDLIESTVWIAAAFVLIRMLATPVLQAGLFHSFHRAGLDEGTRVLEGIRRCWRKIVPLYWLEMALAALPAVWFFPRIRAAFFEASSLPGFVGWLLPYAAAWLAWTFALHLVFRGLQFGAAAGTGPARTLILAFRKAPRVGAVTLAMLGPALLATGAAAAVTHFWAGLAAVVFLQAFHFVRVLLQVWTAAAQFAAWSPDATVPSD